VPRRSVAGALEFENTDNGLAGWQAAGLTLAVISVAAFQGLGPVAGALLLAPAFVALTRLRAHTPTARSTADLVGGVLGGRGAAFTAVLQVIGYPLLVFVPASAFGFGAVFLVPNAFTSPEELLASWWPVIASALAVVVAGVLAYAMTSRAVATVAAVLVSVGLLVYFYFALAIIAKAMSGTEPMAIGGEPPKSGLETTFTVVVLALALVGFEVTTVRNRQLHSLVRPVGLAVAAVCVCAVTVWTAEQLGSTAGFGLTVSNFPLIASEFFGSSATYWLIVAGLAVRAAVLLGLMWAAIQVVGRLGRGGTSGLGAAAGVVAVTAMLVIPFCRGWAGLPDKVDHVGTWVLLVVYVVVAEAYSRASGDTTAAWWIRIYQPVLLAAAVLLPLLYANFAAAAVWPVAVAAVLVMAAAATASVLAGRFG
jgi:hypothetical protein